MRTRFLTTSWAWMGLRRIEGRENRTQVCTRHAQHINGAWSLARAIYGDEVYTYIHAYIVLVMYFRAPRAVQYVCDPFASVFYLCISCIYSRSTCTHGTIRSTAVWWWTCRRGMEWRRCPRHWSRELPRLYTAACMLGHLLIINALHACFCFVFFFLSKDK